MPRFLIANPDWPDESRMRGWAEKAMQPGENAATVLAFFAADKPRTGNGWARLADAYAATGRMAQALDAARQAWRSADLSATDEQAIWARYGGSFTRADNDDRVDALLFAKKADDAARFLDRDQPRPAGGVRGAHRDAAECRRRREPLPGGDRHRHARCRADDGPRALAPRQQLSTRPPQQLAARDHTVSSTSRRIPSASTTC